MCSECRGCARVETVCSSFRHVPSLRPGEAALRVKIRRLAAVLRREGSVVHAGSSPVPPERQRPGAGGACSVGSVPEAQEIVGTWREEYNADRPHSSLGYLTPAELAWLCQMEAGGEEPEGSRGRSLALTWSGTWNGGTSRGGIKYESLSCTVKN